MTHSTRTHWTEKDLLDAKARMSGKGGVAGHPVGPSNSTPRSMGRHEVRDVGTFPVAGSNPAPSLKQYRSKWEPIYDAKLAMDKKLGLILDYWYEPSTWYLEDPVQGKPRKRHKPDFWIWQLDRSIKIVAVKGYHKNIRESLTIIRWAAQRFPLFEWWVTWLRKGNWEEERV